MSYSQRLLHQGSSFTRLAHRSRHSTVLNILDGSQYCQALDYGCGDGWLLRTACEAGLIAGGVGVDIAPQMLVLSQETFADITGFQFCLPDELPHQLPSQSCDLILCTETLEHVENPEEVLDFILHYAKPNAKVVISVPIEIGPSLLVKQTGRYLANLKGNYGYEKYHLNELISAAIFWDVTSFPSSHSIPATFRAHKGFDYRNIQSLLEKKIKVERQVFTPFAGLGQWFNSTVFWIGQVQ